MPTVTLDAIYLAEADDPDVEVVLDHEDITADIAPDGSVEKRAGGRRRAVARPGRDESLSFPVEQVDADTWAQLQAWTRDFTRLVFRDPQGRMWWCVITRLGESHRPASGGDITDLDVTVTRLDDDLAE